MLSREEFQHLLRQFGSPLDKAEVKPQAGSVFLPSWMVKVCLNIMIHGSPQYVEAELDLRSIKNAEDVLGFAGKLLQAFEQHAAGMSQAA